MIRLLPPLPGPFLLLLLTKAGIDAQHQRGSALFPYIEILSRISMAYTHGSEGARLSRRWDTLGSLTRVTLAFRHGGQRDT